MILLSSNGWNGSALRLPSSSSVSEVKMTIFVRFDIVELI